ncbi:MAG: hypothetical protein ACREPJ_16960, partial [Rhodanobacteraceae bacterium]
MKETTANEVVATFAVTSRARSLLRRWQDDPARAHVPRMVMRHVTRVLYELGPADVEAACEASDHPLGDIRKETAMAVTPVVDWRPDFAFTHVMHLALERLTHVPTFQEFSQFCGDDPAGRAALGDPARQIREHARQLGYAPAHATQAVRWRIGLAYYSFVRELYTIAVLRASGLDVRAHPLADALFRVDAWVDRTILCLYIRNSRFRDGRTGRKPRAADILADAKPAFRYAELSLDTSHVFGCVHLPAADQITSIARRMHDASAGRLGYAMDHHPGRQETVARHPLAAHLGKRLAVNDWTRQQQR